MATTSTSPPWTHAASDAPKLQSLLLHARRYPGVQLHHAGPGAALAVEALGASTLRATLFGDVRRPSVLLDYERAAQHLATLAGERSACRQLHCSAIPAAAVPVLDAVLGAAGWRQTHGTPCEEFIVPRGQPAGASLAACVQAAQPHLREQGLQLGTLQPQDAQLVDSLWAFRRPGSLDLIAQLISDTDSSTSCVRRVSDGCPLCWVVEVEPLCAGMLHTLEPHRRQGLARVVLADLLGRLSQQLGESGSDHSDGAAAYAYVVQGNAAALGVMQSLGLESRGTFTWLGFEHS